jgi:hypothetical protein
LNQFLDPDSLATADPWLWPGFVESGEVRRRAPKNIGKVPHMFDGPGRLADRDATLETFLANEVEGPAASALRGVCRRSAGAIDKLPPALMRYLAWAAARSLPMQTLANVWAERGFGRDSETVEPPPQGLADAIEVSRDVQMIHPTLGTRLFPAGSDFEIIACWAQDWIAGPSREVVQSNLDIRRLALGSSTLIQ